MTSVSPSLVSPDISTSSQASTSPIKLGIIASGNGSNFEAVAQAIEKWLNYRKMQIHGFESII